MSAAVLFHAPEHRRATLAILARLVQMTQT